jgi:hypothetical protein
VIDAFIDSVESLANRLGLYRDLDPTPFRELGDQLGGDHGQELQKGTGTAVQRLLYAYLGDDPPAGSESDDDTDYGSGLQSVDAMVASGLWQGPAARTFIEGFLRPMAKAIPLHMLCVLELRRSVEAYRLATERAQQDLNRIVDMGIDVLNRRAVPPHSAAGVGVLRDAVGLVVDVLTLDWFDLGDAGIDLVSGLVEAARHDDRRPVGITVSGGNAPQIVDSIWGAVTELEQLWTDNDAMVRDGLWRDLSDGNPYRSGSWNTANIERSVFFDPGVELDRPEVADQADGFGTSDAGPASVVAVVTLLYQAGWLNLPSAANQYNEAVRVINQLYLPTSYAYIALTSLSRGNFYELRDRLSEILTSVCDILIDAGANLVQIATDYDTTESQNVGQFDQLRDDGFEQVREDFDPPPAVTPAAGPTRVGVPHHAYPSAAG